MPEFSKNLWAPWRMEYINQLPDMQGSCFICAARDNPDKDAENFVLWRGRHCLAMFNRYPYTNGHMLVAPLAHKAGMSELTDDEMLQIMHFTRDLKHLMRQVMHPEGFNAGMNFGKCAGAGLPGHLHLHLVPRWVGDTNFMCVISDVRVIPQSMEKLYAQLRRVSERLGLPQGQ